MSELTREQVEVLLTKPAGIRSSLEAERACIAVLVHDAALRAKVDAFEQCQAEVARNLGWDEGQQLTKQSFILQQLATLTADRDTLREAGLAVDATWNADEPYPPYMDCVDTDALLQLRAALRGEGEG